MLAQQSPTMLQRNVQMIRQYFKAIPATSIMRMIVPYRRRFHIRPRHLSVIEQCIPIFRIVQRGGVVDDDFLECIQMRYGSGIADAIGFLRQS